MEGCYLVVSLSHIGHSPMNIIFDRRSAILYRSVLGHEEVHTKVECSRGEVS